jgi:hypothetical protein
MTTISLPCTHGSRLAQQSSSNVPKLRKSRRNRPPRSAARPIHWGGTTAPATDRRTNLAIAIVAAVLLTAAGVYGWQTLSIRWSFDTLAGRGAEALKRIETLPSAGRDHLAPGQAYAYPDPFPTSGPHDLSWAPPGLYETQQSPTRLVHALEHGNIVIYYDEPGAAALASLREWAALYDGQWDGVVVTPSPRLGEEIVLTAWTKTLRLEKFDAEAAAAFIDAFRGRGPENPIR